MLEDLLRALEVELVTHGVPVNEFLKPGADPRSIRAEFASSGLIAPAEAVAWFEWHDGRYEVPGSEEALPVFEAWSLDYLRAEREDPHSQRRGYGEWDWNPGWIHLMGDQTALAMCCTAPPDENPLVRMVSTDGFNGTQDHQTARQVVSLCTPVTWWIDSLRRGFYTWDAKASAWIRHSAAQPLIRSVYGLT